MHTEAERQRTLSETPLLEQASFSGASSYHGVLNTISEKFRILGACLGILGAAGSMVGSTGCTSVVPDAGEEAVLVEKPLFFGTGGVIPAPVKTGREYVALSTDHILVSVVPFKHEERFDDMVTKDNINVDLNAYLVTRVTDSPLLKGSGVLSGPSRQCL